MNIQEQQSTQRLENDHGDRDPDSAAISHYKTVRSLFIHYSPTQLVTVESFSIPMMELLYVIISPTIFTHGITNNFNSWIVTPSYLFVSLNPDSYIPGITSGCEIWRWDGSSFSQLCIE